jgi:hypothetical protein
VSRRLAARVALWLVPVLLAGVAVREQRQREAPAALEQGRERLLAGRWEEAGAAFDAAARNRTTAAAAARGRALADLMGGRSKTAPAEVPPDLARALMDVALRAGHLEAVHALAQGAGAWGRIHEAAALVEEGREPEARALIHDAPAFGLAQRVRDVLDLHVQAAGPILHAADGSVLGVLDTATGEAVGLDPLCVPRAALLELAAAPRAPGLRLSIDMGLCGVAQQALGARRGTIVLLDPRSGAILAVVSDTRSHAEMATPAWEERREPASTSKVITTAAALRAGLDPDALIKGMTCEGHARYGPGQLWCSFPAGPLQGGLPEAFAVSCNVAFANLGIRMGRPALLDELRRWGFDRADAPWAGHIVQPGGTDLDLAHLSVGLDATDITPVHAALMGAVLGSGRMPEPHVVIGTDDVLGLRAPTATPTAEPRPVLDDKTRALIADALRGVTEEGGTAQGATPASFPVVMKTGTAAEPGQGYHVNYVGAGPRAHPRVAFCVRVTHEATSHRVNDVAHRVLYDLLEGVGARLETARTD